MGAFVESNAWKPTTLEAFQKDTNQQLGISTIYTNFDYDWRTLSIQATNVSAQGAVPMITLEPTLAARPNDNLLIEIIDGHWDAYLELWATDFVDWAETRDDDDPKVMLRFAHEFNGIWYPWGNAPDDYVDAWRHAHGIFEASGANAYLEWVWNVNNVDVDDYNDVTLYYPGDDVVDWTSIDGFNWGSNFSFSQWRSFRELFAQQYNVLMSNYPDKPILIAEVACAEPLDVPNQWMDQNGDDSDRHESKDDWIEDMFATLSSEFKGVKAIVWFNVDKEFTWSINGPFSTGQKTYKNKLKSGYFTSTYKRAEDHVAAGTVKGTRGGAGNASLKREADGFRAMWERRIARSKSDK